MKINMVHPENELVFVVKVEYSKISNYYPEEL